MNGAALRTNSIDATLEDKELMKMHVDLQKRFPMYHVCPKCLATYRLRLSNPPTQSRRHDHTNTSPKPREHPHTHLFTKKTPYKLILNTSIHVDEIGRHRHQQYKKSASVVENKI